MTRVYLLLFLLANSLIRSDAINFEDEHSLVATRYLPIVLWHGMGDSCCDSNSIGAVVDYIKSRVPGIFVHSIATGNTEAADIVDSYFGLVDDQVDRVCDELRTITELQHGYTAVGFSQGGQFLRAVVQRCQHRGPAAHTLVTMGAQHEGVMDVPGCWEPSFNSTPSWACRAMQKLLASAAYNPWVQGRIIQAQYFKDPEHLEAYYRNSAFLADINLEALPSRGSSSISAVGKNKIFLENKNARRGSDVYKNNLMTLKKLVLFMFDNDITVVPKESSHFGWFDGRRLVPLTENKIYTEDRIGLKVLNESGRLVLAHAPGFHMQFSFEWFFDNVVQPYLLVLEAQ